VTARPPAVVRAAPSPTGDPHVGTAYVSLFDLCLARKTGGRFILRIEDTDRTRYDPSSEAKIFESLRWLGLAWDEGPDVGGPHGPYRQSERTETYREHADRLLENGTAYRCFCTEARLEELRATQRAMKVPPGYDGRCRALPRADAAARAAAGEAHTVRMAVPKEGSTSFRDELRGEVTFENRTIDDQVLLKNDRFPTYHLANVVDDHLMGVTDVVRGEEWIASTPKHVLLYRAFGWEPPRWTHMPLLRNPDRSKMSKRKNPTSITWYRDQGFLPEALLNFLALMGYSHSQGREKFTLDEMVADFDPARITTSGPVFDLEKLKWLNGEYLREMAPDELSKRLVEHFLRRVAERPEPRQPHAVLDALEEAARAGGEGRFAETVHATVPLVRERIKTLEEYASIAACFFRDDVSGYAPDDLLPKKRTLDEAKDALRRVRDAVAGLDPFDPPAIEGALRAVADAMGWKPGDLFTPVRTAVTGSRISPPLFETMALLGRERCLRRLDRALA
jgi:glutamyl-tRNA synthetase